MSISTFEGASAVYTFAGNPAILMVITFFVAAASLFALGATMVHEKHSYADPEPKKLKP
ncbi:hypothetical protein [Stutzerimonas tarimensis]|uniref:Uncharacterized protein n=1 Tax=Stutzerimonas tarimensis TaxID=1507735 RepID=A0ABV7TAF8_9GAMM